MSSPFIYLITREQKEYVALCDYYLGVLTPLADPKSRTHWIEYFMALDHESIPPHALYAATLHGYYVLQSGPDQILYTSLVLDNISSPHPISILNLENTTIHHEAESRWRPSNYISLHEKVTSRPAWKDNINKPLRCEITPRLAQKQDEVLLKLAQLEVNIQDKNKELAASDSLEMKCEVINAAQGVGSEPVEERHIQVGEECCVCLNVQRIDIVAEIGVLTLETNNKALDSKRDSKKTARGNVLAMTRRAKHVLSAQKKEEFNALRELVGEDVQGMSLRDELINHLTADILHFGESLKTATSKVEELKESRCVDTVGFKCGHMLGLDCASLWLNRASTCPQCRFPLATSTPEEPIHNVSLTAATAEEDQVMEDAAPAADEDEDADYYRTLNGIHNFNCDGILRTGLGDNDQYEDDVDLSDEESEE